MAITCLCVFFIKGVPITRFTEDVIKIIKSIPEGRVMTYGAVAALAGNPRGARQVSWILHSFTQKYRLPWHRVVNSKGTISIPDHDGYEEQRTLLQNEGIEFGRNDKINLEHSLWSIRNINEIKDKT